MTFKKIYIYFYEKYVRMVYILGLKKCSVNVSLLIIYFRKFFRKNGKKISHFFFFFFYNFFYQIVYYCMPKNIG